MYDSLGLAALKEDALEVGSAAVGTVAGIAVAKFVAGTLVGTEAKPGFLRSAADKSKFVFPGADKVAPLVPVAVGVAIYSMGAAKMGRGALRDATAGVAAGMVAYGIGSLVASFTAKANDTMGTLGLSGLGSVYDYSLDGLGMGPGDVSAYMMAGSPITEEPLAATPVDVQQFNGAPVSFNTESPMNATLVA